MNFTQSNASPTGRTDPAPTTDRWSSHDGLPDRTAWLRRFRRAVASNEPHLRRLIAEEIGKPEWEALTADIMPLLAACRWLERRAPALLRPRRVRHGAFWQLAERHRVHRHPLGDVAIIATWNYPVQLLGIQLIQAITAGNRVVVKPSEHSPRTQARLLELAQGAGLPDGVLSWVDATREAGRTLLSGRRFDHVVFTGSTSVGRAIAAWGAETLTPTTLELSGHDSAFVLADADTRLAAECLWHAVSANAGQTCMAPRRILVEAPAYASFLSALAPFAAAARPVTLISPGAAEHAFHLAHDAIAAGARSLSGVAEPPAGARMRPLAVVDCPASAALVGGDHFGPVVAVVPVRSRDEALRIHLRAEQHLATSIFTRRPAAATSWAALLRSSNVVFNDAVRPVGHPGVSLGGCGLSGWGVTRGAEGLLALTRAVHISATDSFLRTAAAAPPRKVMDQLAGFVRRWYGGRALPAAPEPLTPAPAGALRPTPLPPHSTHPAEATEHGSIRS